MHNGRATNGRIGHSGCLAPIVLASHATMPLYPHRVGPDPLLTIPTSIFTHHPAQPHQRCPAPRSLRRNHTRIRVAQRRAGPSPTRGIYT
ncbi:hypothetical protein FIBSPDRAFT_849089 [Athelia psychrophila]|uniref:Uncharacterized protein n=1 Tax=Athelia psychrophila TaxID=1759441 RepID=A0A166UWL0_9AGAM|nr:hypothetical protein FIBSPDRAFT_849089 [Fibularhizoctonia sp. CBS 109695]